MNFKPTNQHILIFPEEITEVAKKITREDGVVVELLQGDRTRDLKIKAVNKGTVIRSSSEQYKEGQILVYYPYSPNKLDIEEKEYHVIHERDVMGIVQ